MVPHFDLSQIRVGSSVVVFYADYRLQGTVTERSEAELKIFAAKFDAKTDIRLHVDNYQVLPTSDIHLDRF